MKPPVSSYTRSIAFCLLLLACGGNTRHPADHEDAEGGSRQDHPFDAGHGLTDARGTSFDDAGPPAEDGGLPGAGADRCGPFDFSAAKAVLMQAVEEKRINGAGLAVLRKGCPPLMLESFGNQTNTTVLELASASKAPAATAIVTLVQSGTLGLDSPIGDVVPDAPADKAPITLRQLLSHTSGLPGNVPCLGNDATTLAACAQQILKTPLQTKPGTAFAYGGASFHVAGYLAEVVTKKAWNVLFSEALAAPCGATTLSFAASPRNALGSDTNPRIAGGAAANLVDYARFMQLYTSGGHCTQSLLSPSRLDALLTNQIGSLDQSQSVLPGAKGDGLGWWHEPVEGEVILSDPGAFGTYPWIDGSHDYAAVLLIRKSLQVGHELGLKLRARIVTSLRR